MLHVGDQAEVWGECSEVPKVLKTAKKTSEKHKNTLKGCEMCEMCLKYAKNRSQMFMGLLGYISTA